LETLYVDIREPYYSSDIFLVFWSGDGFSNVLALQYLPLKMVTVVVMGRLNEYRWPKVHAAKLGMAEATRTRLLGYQGQVVKR
jgi:hypothetical protein